MQKAIDLAVKAHAGQWREGEGALPYVTHPIEVLLNLRYVGGVTDDEILCASVLHDTIEAGGASFNEIDTEFGQTVAQLVQELTRSEPTSQETEGLGKSEIWEVRAKMLVDEISRMTPKAQQIKLADRLANMRDAVRLKKGKKLERYKRQTREILRVVHRDVNPGLWDAVGRLAGIL